MIYYWGFEGWVVYVVVGLSFGIFCYNFGLLLILWFVFYLILGECVWGWWGYIIDMLVVFVIFFGLIILLGLGV